MADNDALTLALVQMNSNGSLEDNVGKASAFIERAVDEHRPDLIVIPEFFNIPYVFQYRDYRHIDRAERDDGYAITRMRDLARRHRVNVVATIFEEESAGVCYDSAMVIDRSGEIVGKYRKTHPAAVRSLEKIYFRYGSYFPVFRVDGWRVGLIICYDTFFPETARCVAVNGAELILVPFAAPPVKCWRELMIARAFENGAYFAPCNKVGLEGEWTFGGSSMIVDPYGEVLTELDDREEGIIASAIDRQAVFAARREKPMLRDRRPDLYRPICTPTEDIPRV